MQAADYTLPSIDLVVNLPSDCVKTVTTNIFYPNRSTAHVPWAGPTKPLVIVPTVYEEPLAYANNLPNSAPITLGLHAAPENRILRWIKSFFLRIRSGFREGVERLKKRIASVHHRVFVLS